MGAAVMAAKACYRSGLGLLTLDTPYEERTILQTTLPEAMLLFREKTNDLQLYDAAGVGPAMGTSKLAVRSLKRILKEFQDKKVVLDADALNILSAHKKMMERLPVGTIITPHPLEFDRLFGKSADPEERIDKALRFSTELNCVIVLKTHQTLVAFNGKGWLNTTGNAGLAKGGSGDVLTGIITAFLAQDYSVEHAACLGVYLHGLAADLALKDQSQESMIASDVIDHLGQAFKSLHESKALKIHKPDS
jgi:ADP-dependent NAD(P)H-hydrate dehydratase / NAD(P)H-hydrate epimerase